MAHDHALKMRGARVARPSATPPENVVQGIGRRYIGCAVLLALANGLNLVAILVLICLLLHGANLRGAAQLAMRTQAHFDARISEGI